MINTKFVEQSYDYLTGINHKEFEHLSIFRPYMDYKPIPGINLNTLPTAIDFFANEKLLRDYNFLNKPTNGKIITLGVIS
jgi:hypothetical protein